MGTKKQERLSSAIIRVLVEISDVLCQKLGEEMPFTGKIDFTVHCHQGGVGNVEAFSRLDIKNGSEIKTIDKSAVI